MKDARSPLIRLLTAVLVAVITLAYSSVDSRLPLASAGESHIAAAASTPAVALKGYASADSSLTASSASARGKKLTPTPNPTQPPAPIATSTAVPPTATNTAVPPTATAVAPSATPAGASTRLEAESLSMPTSYDVYSDSLASGQKSVTMWSNGALTGSYTGSIASLSLRARGDQCNGAPHVQVLVDNQVALDASVASTSYADYSKGYAAASGTHSLTVRFDNDFESAGVCDRNLIADSLTLNASSSPASTPSPTATKPAATPSPTATTPPQPTTPPTATVLPSPTPVTGSHARWSDITIRGANYWIQNADWTSNGDNWAGTYVHWNWSGIQSQIDLAAKTNLNGFRMVGSAAAVLSGQISEATYFSHVDQVADYLAAKGMYFYPSCTNQSGVNGYSADQIAGFCADLAQHLDSRWNVVGLDLIQEEANLWSGATPWGSYDQVLALAKQVYSSAKAKAPGLPLTYSEAVNFAHPEYSQTWNDYAPIVDYWDNHAYDGQAASGATVGSLTKGYVVGEFGGSDANYQALLGVVGQRHSSVFQWCIVGDSGYALYNWDGSVMHQSWINLTQQFPSSGFYR